MRTRTTLSTATLLAAGALLGWLFPVFLDHVGELVKLRIYRPDLAASGMQTISLSLRK